MLSEKDLEGPLWELEMALLESDVALPVAESIIATVKADLSGSTRNVCTRPRRGSGRSRRRHY